MNPRKASSQLVQLGLVAASVFLASCNDEEVLNLGNEVREMSVTLEGLKKRLGELADEASRDRNKASTLAGDIRNLQRYQRLELEVAKEFNDAKTYEEDLKASVAFLDGKIAVWKDATRKSLIGANLGSVTLMNGTSLTEARVVQVLDGLVKLQHQGGEASVPMAELPVALREQLVDESLILQKLRIE